MDKETINQLWLDYWRTEGVRYLVDGNRAPTPEERSRHAFYTAITLITMDFQLPKDAYIAAVSFDEDPE